MINRIYIELAKRHLENNRQMLFLMGPRQVGKTTISKALMAGYDRSAYYSWDNLYHRDAILGGGKEIVKSLKLDIVHTEKALVIFDELHKFRGWKTFLKGFFDTYENHVNIVVTGSSRLDIYRRGGDSLMGRYFLMRIHPLSIRELADSKPPKRNPSFPVELPKLNLHKLKEFGGFPEPFIKGDVSFAKKWRDLRRSALFHEDLREMTRIQELGQVEVLAELLRYQVGELTQLTKLAKKVRVSVDTIKRWLEVLKSFYFCFEIRPWTKNVARSLLKEPKYYLWDWSLVDDESFRLENIVASHLLKFKHYYTDLGLGDCDLFFIRDKEKREVDFLLTKNERPWLLLEVKKNSKSSISKNLVYFQKSLSVPHAYQVSDDLDYSSFDCFENSSVMKLSFATLCSQLI